MQKKKLFILIFILISLPGIQYFTSLIKVKPLKGWFIQEPNPSLNLNSWLDGTFQKGKEKYLKQKFGFRPDFVRINNQLDYSLFGQLNANSLIVGKDEYLFESNYIKAYYGTDFIGDSIVIDKVEKLKYIQSKLNKKGKNICIILAPGKGSFFPEYIPESHKKNTIGKTNYEAYSTQLKLTNLPLIDFQDWFLKHKSLSPYPLYSQGGIHWSRYGEIMATDSIANYIGLLTNKHVPDLIIDRIDVTRKNQFRDYDIGEALNLMLPQNTSTYPMAYPSYHIKSDSTTEQVKSLFVSDSFYWGMFNSGFSNSLFGKGQFWYYNQQIYPDSYNKPLNVSDIDIIKGVEQHDVVVLMSTDANLFKFAYGFIDQLYLAYQNQNNNQLNQVDSITH